MRTGRLMGLVLAVFWAGSTQPVRAATYTGTISDGQMVTYRYNPGNGQTIFTLTWETKGTELFLVLGCDLEGETFGWGTGWGRVDRIARLEVGTVGPIARCVLVVSSFNGSTPYTLNAQTTRSQGLTKTLTGTSGDGDPALTLDRLDNYPQLMASLNRQVSAVRRLDDRAGR